DLDCPEGKGQDETNAANVEGKQKLRKLEKEIAGLRVELEQSHQKNGELEERIDKVKSEHDRQMEAQRLEREAHTSTHHPSEEDIVGYQNFAPAESFTPSKRKGSVGVNSQTSTPESVPFPSSEVETSRLNPNTGEPSPELTLLGQLLSKIQELEATNREILEQYRDTDTRLRNASTRSNALKKFYDNLEDEMHADDEGGTFSADQSPLGASLSRSKGIMYSIHNQSAKSLRERGSPVSSLRGATDDLLSSYPSQTRRPPLGGLFDDPASSDQGDHLRVEAPTDDSDFEAHHNVASGSGISNMDRLKLRPSASIISRRKLRPKASFDTRSLKAHGSSSPHSLPTKSVRTSKS
ncbi:11382_t:CDS:1, partial [Acaulospora colombiana]